MDDAAPTLPKPVMAVRRAIDILRYLGRADEAAGVQEIARALGLVPSTCLHILRTLAHEGVVTAEPESKRYRLGPTLLRLARDMTAKDGFIQRAQPMLDSLAAEMNATAAAAALDGPDRIIILAKSSTPNDLSIDVTVGSRFPALISAIGIGLAAYADLPADRLSAEFAAVRWQNPPDFDRWAEEVARAKATGIAVDPGFYLQGVTVVAAPVFDAERRPTRYLVALGFSQQLAGDALATLSGRMKAMAADMAREFPPPAPGLPRSVSP